MSNPDHIAEFGLKSYLAGQQHKKRMEARKQIRIEESQPIAYVPTTDPYEFANCLGSPDCRRPAARDGLCHRHYALEAVSA